MSYAHALSSPPRNWAQTGWPTLKGILDLKSVERAWHRSFWVWYTCSEFQIMGTRGRRGRKHRNKVAAAWKCRIIRPRRWAWKENTWLCELGQDNPRRNVRKVNKKVNPIGHSIRAPSAYSALPGHPCCRGEKRERDVAWAEYLCGQPLCWWCFSQVSWQLCRVGFVIFPSLCAHFPNA